MNPELQAQSDALTKAISDAATTAHQDALLLCFVLGVLLTILILAVTLRKP